MKKKELFDDIDLDSINYAELLDIIDVYQNKKILEKILIDESLSDYFRKVIEILIKNTIKKERKNKLIEINKI